MNQEKIRMSSEQQIKKAMEENRFNRLKNEQPRPEEITPIAKLVKMYEMQHEEEPVVIGDLKPGDFVRFSSHISEDGYGQAFEIIDSPKDKVHLNDIIVRHVTVGAEDSGDTQRRLDHIPYEATRGVYKIIPDKPIKKNIAE